MFGVPCIRSPLVFSAVVLLTLNIAGSASAKKREFYLREIRRLENILKDQPENVELMWALAGNYYHAGNTETTGKKSLDAYQRCQELSKRAVAVNPRSAEAHFWLGICYGGEASLKGMLRGLFLSARIKREMKTVVALDPAYNHAGGHRALGRLFFKLPALLGGDIDRARAHLEEAVHIAPGFSTNHLYLAEVYLRKREYESAYRELRSLQELPQAGDGEGHDLSERERAGKLMQAIPAPIRKKLSFLITGAGR